MAVPPRYPPPPGSSPHPPDGLPPEEPWLHHTPNHYVHVKKGTPTTLVLGAGVVLVAAVVGAWMMLTKVSGADVVDAVEEQLGKVTCPGATNGLELHILAQPHGTEGFVANAPSPEVASCIEQALAGADFTSGQDDTMIVAKLSLAVDGNGKLSVASEGRQIQRQTAEWRRGTLGENINAERARIERVLEANFAEMLGCYVEGSMRTPQRITLLPWYSESEVAVRVRVAPNGAITGASVSRPGVSESVADWTRGAVFQTCSTDLLGRMPWPSHKGSTWEWVNTSFIVTASKM